MIRIKQFFAYNELRNFSYLLYEDSTGEAWVIDPYEATPIIDYIKENSLRPQGILNTHQHFDHVRGNRPLQEAFSCGARSFSGGERVSLSDSGELVTLDTPGHTMDHQVFVLQEKAAPPSLFSGDTLFNAGVGNCRNGGNVDLLFETTKRLIETLPPETLLYPGHDYSQRNLEFALTLEPENTEIKERLREARDTEASGRRVSSLAEEGLVNPFLRLSSGEIREHFGANSLDEREPLERNLFKKIRSLRDKW